MDLNERNIQIERFKEDFDIITEEVSKAIVGQKQIVENVTAAIIAGGNVLLEGLPGLGKTRLVKTLGKALDLSFSRIQFTPDLMPADVTGTDIISASGGFEFQKGPIFSNIVLADEINRATPKTQSALLEAMQEKTVTVGKVTYELPKPFFVLATQNPIEMEGTYPLPEAQMDRFIVKLDVDFPSKDELRDIVLMTTTASEAEIKSVADAHKINAMGEAAKAVPIAAPVLDYAIDLVAKTHPNNPETSEAVKKYIVYGSSPRGAQAIITMARIYALLDSRFNVAYDDINKAAFVALGHRLFLNFEAIAEGITAEAILKTIVKRD